MFYVETNGAFVQSYIPLNHGPRNVWAVAVFGRVETWPLESLLYLKYKHEKMNQITTQ